MEVGAKLICMVKTNTKGLCKENIENLRNDCTGGSYLVSSIKPMVLGGRLIISIVYKYNARKSLYFIVTENAGITYTSLPYLPKSPD